MVRRDVVVGVFITAFLALGLCAKDALEQAVAGHGGAIMTEMVNSWPGLVIALVVLGFSGWWLIRDTRKAERKEQERQAELQAVLERMDKVLEQNAAILSRLEARDGSENTTSEE